MSEAEITMGGHAPGLMEKPAFSVPAKKMAMWLFIIADTATFAACLVAYGFTRNATPNWPRPFHSITNVAIMTFILVTSSLTVLFAVRASKADDRAGAFRWTMITAAGGLLFALLHLREWMSLIGEGLRLFQNPWGAPMFGAAFFSITGLHMAHVVGGVIALVVVGFGYKSGRYASKHIEIWALYWHFVDLVWMFVVPLMYLLNMKR